MCVEINLFILFFDNVCELCFMINMKMKFINDTLFLKDDKTI